MYTTPNQISVNAKGSAESRFTKATFKVTVSEVASTGPEAKNKIDPLIGIVFKIIQANAETAGLEADRVTTTKSVEPEYTHTNSGGRVASGYRATFTASFAGRNVIEALSVHDQLTSLAGVVADTPVFHVDDASEFANAAFADGVKKARAKFEAQCKALSLDPAAYQVSSWSIEDEQPRGKSLSFTDGAKPRGSAAEPGKAMLDVRVQVLFTKKP
jgi:uncharacterized protein YggE